jgi:signal transduction histidine kinase
MQMIAGTVLGGMFLCILLAGYFARRWLAEHRNPLHLSLVLLCLALAGYSYSTARLYVSLSLEEGVFWGSMQMAAAAVALIPLFEFSRRFALGGRPGKPLARWRWVFHVVTLGVAALNDPSRPALKEYVRLGIPLRYLECAPSPYGIAFIVFGTAVVVVSSAYMLRAAARDRRDAVPVASGSLVFLATIVNDGLVNARVVDNIYLLEFGFLALLCAYVYTLLERSSRLAEELRSRAGDLERANRELEGVYGDLRRSYDSLSQTQQELYETERLADLGRMAASLAHEIRNPLCVLQNVAAALRRHCEAVHGPEEAKTLIAALSDEVSRLDQLVDDLLAFARPDRCSRTDVSLPAIADQAILAVVSALPQPAKYEIGREYETPHPRAWVDVERIRRALVNLITNACQAMPSGGRVTVIVRRGDDPGTFRVGVRDQGEGIGVDVLPRIFEPFFSTKPSGTGLGLPIVRAIARDHGGHVTVETAPGPGATFWIHLGGLVSRRSSPSPRPGQ